MEDYIDKKIRYLVIMVGGGFWKIKKRLKIIWKIDLDKNCLFKRLRRYEKKS